MNINTLVTGIYGEIKTIVFSVRENVRSQKRAKFIFTVCKQKWSELFWGGGEDGDALCWCLTSSRTVK